MQAERKKGCGHFENTLHCTVPPHPQPSKETCIYKSFQYTEVGRCATGLQNESKMRPLDVRYEYSYAERMQMILNKCYMAVLVPADDQKNNVNIM